MRRTCSMLAMQILLWHAAIHHREMLLFFVSVVREQTISARTGTQALPTVQACTNRHRTQITMLAAPLRKRTPEALLNLDTCVDALCPIRGHTLEGVIASRHDCRQRSPAFSLLPYPWLCAHASSRTSTHPPLVRCICYPHFMPTFVKA